MLFHSAAVSGDCVVIGAWFEDSPATGVDGAQGSDSAVDAGAVYVFVPSPWTDLGGGTVGSAGPPTLVGCGTLAGGSEYSLTLTQAPPSALMVAWFSFAPTAFQAAGGVVLAYPFQHERLFFADASGAFTGVSNWPVGMPSDMRVWFQFYVEDAATLHGLTLSNGLLATAP